MRTFVISLKTSLDRRARVDELMARHRLAFEYFDAIDPRVDRHAILDFYDAAKCRRLKGYGLTDAELGCFASHYSLWQLCAKADRPMLILEDNFELRGNLGTRLAALEAKVGTYDVLKLGGVFERPRVAVDRLDDEYEIVRHPKGIRGTSAYVISPDRATAWAAQAPGFFEPVDNFTEAEWRTRLPVFSIHPWLVARTKTASVIGARKRRSRTGAAAKLVPELYRGYTRARQWLYHATSKGTAGFPADRRRAGRRQLAAPLDDRDG